MIRAKIRSATCACVFRSKSFLFLWLCCVREFRDRLVLKEKPEAEVKGSVMIYSLDELALSIRNH